MTGHSAKTLLCGLTNCRDDAKLLEHTQAVPDLPAFHDLTISKTQNMNALDSDLLTGPGDAQKLTRMGSPKRPAGRDPIPLRDHILNGVMDIMECTVDCPDGLLEPFPATLLTGECGMVIGISRE